MLSLVVQAVQRPSVVGGEVLAEGEDFLRDEAMGFNSKIYLLEWHKLTKRQQQRCHELAIVDGSTVSAAFKKIFPGKWKQILKANAKS